MKILMVSRFYPPRGLSGYELRCASTAEGLQQRGHEVTVVTSRVGLRSQDPLLETIRGVQVHRVLTEYYYQGPVDSWAPTFLSSKDLIAKFPVMVPRIRKFLQARRQLADVDHFTQILDDFRPDVINWWSLTGLTKAILSAPRMRGIPDVYCADNNWAVENFVRGVTDEWPTWTSYWTKDAQPRDEQAEQAQHEQDRQRPSGPWLRRRVESWLNDLEAKLVRRGIATTYSKFSPSHVCFVSDYVFRDSVEHDVFYPSTEIIHGGAAASKFYFRRPRATAQDGDPIWLLYVGTINRDRGLHTLIEALHELPPQARALIRLTVAGDSDDEAYLQGIHEQVRALRLADQVVFLGRVVVDGMPDIYRCHDILVVPSIRMDGLPLRMIEAMLSGCAVITTGSGGAIEIARAADLPLFRKDNPPTLAKVLEQLIRDRKSLNCIARRGQRVALEQFTCDRMVDRLALAMRSLIEAKRASLCAAASQP